METQATVTKRRFHRTTAAVLTMLLGVAGVLLGTAAPAGAAVAGTVTPSQTAGLITDTPMFGQASVSQACPTGYQSGVGVYVAYEGGEEALVHSVTDGAPYDEPFTFALPAASFALSDVIGQTGADGSYEIRVRCLPAAGTPIDRAQHFSFVVEVTGDRWELATSERAYSSVRLSASPARQVVTGEQYTLTARVRPSGAAGMVHFSSGSQTFGVSPVNNGVATLTLQASRQVDIDTINAEFFPADPATYKPSTTSIEYATVLPASIELRDAAGTVLTANPTLTPGQTVTVGATGFQPSERVWVVVPCSDAWYAKTTADARGTVSGYQLRLPADIEAGSYELSLVGLNGGTTLTFPFTVGG